MEEKKEEEEEKKEEEKKNQRNQKMTRNPRRNLHRQKSCKAQPLQCMYTLIMIFGIF